MSNEIAGAQTPQVQGKFLGIVVCFILGNGSLFAWNSMLTIEDYYVALFPDYHPTRVLTLVYQPFAFAITCIMAYYEAKMNTRRRNLAGFSLFFIGSFALIILDIATKGRGGLGVFVGVCIISAIFGTADANCQGALVGDLSLMCPEFIQSFLSGLAASGALTSALRLITKAAFENSKDGLRIGAILFFSVTCLFELLCLLLYKFVFPKLPIVKYYRSKAAAEGSKTVASDLAAAGLGTEQHGQAEEDPQICKRLSTKELLVENVDYAFDIYLIYVLTLSIFPGFLSEDTGSHSLGTWYALVLIAMYNVWDLIGRYLPLIPCITLTSRKGMTCAILARFLFIPAFYFTAKYGDQGYMILLTSLLGLSNGYLTVCVLVEAPRGYKGPEQNALGNVLVVCLLGGIFSGVVLDWLWLIGKGW
ncbi:equilibrative nucleotide transporter 3-like [Phragmites australis]|uniref:equilibrative nucleotide transporter 3-like n=1 Tax=Phragmites australis TaxID=29695 RepID=UPI002D76F275|nr:equilibrative nucleotide transporter 3-like [Phragmites australis]